MGGNFATFTPLRLTLMYNGLSSGFTGPTEMPGMLHVISIDNEDLDETYQLRELSLGSVQTQLLLPSFE